MKRIVGVIIAIVLTACITITLTSIPSIVLAADPPIPLEEKVFNVTFETTGQSMWEAGSGPSNINIDIPIIDANWNAHDSTSNTQTIMGYKVGGEISGGTSGAVGVSAEFDNIFGTVDITYPVQVKLITPGAGSFGPGDTITINSSTSLLPGYKIQTHTLSGNFDIMGLVDINAHADASIYTPTKETVNFFPPIDARVYEPIFTISSTNPTTITPLETLVHGISGTYGLPNVSTTVSVDGDGKSLIASGSDTFLNLKADLDKWSKLPLGFHTPSFSGVPGQFSYDILDAVTNFHMKQEHKLKFTPNVRISLAFPVDVAYTVNGVTGTSNVVTFDAGDSVEIVYPEDVTDLSITPSFALKNTFSNDTKTTFTQDLRVKTLELSLKIPRIKIIPEVRVQITHWTPEWDDLDKHHHHWRTITPAVYSPEIDLGKLGPVWHDTIAEYSVPNDSLFDNNRAPWEVRGFNTLGKPAFKLAGAAPVHPPTAVISSPPQANEGQSFTLSGEQSTDPVSGVLTYSWAFGDGNIGMGISVSHTYLNDGIYTASLTVDDGYGGINTTSAVITVNNVSPTVSAATDTASIDEGGVIKLSGSITDPGTQDTFQVEINWGDGSGKETLALPAGTTSYSATHQYLDDNPTGTAFDNYAINVIVKDDDGGQGIASTVVRVNNIPPAATAVTDTASIDEGEVINLSGEITDPGTQDTFQVEIDWGDGSAKDILNYPAGATSYSATHQYLDDNPTGTASDNYTINVNVKDDDSSQGNASAVVTVNNVPPGVTATTDTATVDEGGVIKLSGEITDPGMRDTFTLIIDWGDSSAKETLTLPAGTTSYNTTHQCLDDNPTGTASDEYTISVILSDDDGGKDSTSAIFTVPNVAPVVDAGLDATINQSAGMTFIRSGNFTDPGTDVWTATVDYGDGSGVQLLTLTGKTFSLNHTYVRYGIYTVTITIRDDDGGISSDNASVTVIDNVAPTTTASHNPAPTPSNWNNSTVTVTLTAVDNTGGSGVKEIHYAINGATANVVISASASISLSTEGIFNIAYFAKDNAGNAESANSLTIRIDKTPPTITFGTPDPLPNAAGWNNANVSVPFTANDSLSGVASTSRASPIVLDTEGSAVTGSVVVNDIAGNSATFTTPIFKIDKTPPTISGARTPAANANGWNNSDVKVAFTFSDALSGISASPSSTVLSGEGAGQSVTGSVTDVAGNGSSFTVSGINIDKTKPTLTFGQPNPLPNANGWNNSDVTIAYTAEDNLSGVASSIPIGPLSFTSEAANQAQTVTVTDSAGNSETFATTKVSIDKSKPLITITSPYTKNYLTSEALSVNFLVNDGVSGIGVSEAKLDGNTVVNGQVVNLANMGGAHTFTVSATDKAGNSYSVTVSFYVVIDSKVDVNPDTLNLKSQSDKNAITVYIEFPVGYDVGQINVSTVKMVVNGVTIAAQLSPTSVGDFDSDRVPDRMVKFDRQAVISATSNIEGGIWTTIAKLFGWKVDLKLVVNGFLHDGRNFTGEDTIKVILPGK